MAKQLLATQTAAFICLNRVCGHAGRSISRRNHYAISRPVVLEPRKGDEMRTVLKTGVWCVMFTMLVGCGTSDEREEATLEVPTSVVSEATKPTATAVPPEPAATAEPATPSETTSATDSDAPAQSAATSRQPLPVMTELAPGPYEVTRGDTTLWLEIPDFGDEIRFLSPPQTEWQVSIILVGDSAGTPEPGFGLAWAEDGATVESVTETIRVSDFERHSFVTSTGVFQGIETTIITRVSGLAEGAPSDQSIVTVSTGEESRLQNMYAHDWTIEHHVFERDGRVLIVSYEWAPGLRGMLLAEAAPVVESFELRSAS